MIDKVIRYRELKEILVGALVGRELSDADIIIPSAGSMSVDEMNELMRLEVEIIGNSALFARLTLVEQHELGHGVIMHRK